MTDITISIPDALMEKLRPHLHELPRVLELGVEQVVHIPPVEPQSFRKRIMQMLADQGIAHPLDKSLVTIRDPNRSPQKRLKIDGKPLSEIITEQRGS